MNLLLVYPEYPDTFWGFKHALKFISKKATQPPLGLLTVAAMLPEGWNKKLVDMNVQRLKKKDLNWADLVLISAMSIQKESAREVVARCLEAGVRTVAGGPLFTAIPEEFADVDHLVLNEAEVTLPQFLADFEKGQAARLYTSDKFISIENTPAPKWDLLNMRKYASMNIQYSRGCPYDCEFCDISVLFGKKVRTKSSKQIVAELENLYTHGWRGDVFFVDDNFIGHRKKLKQKTLPAMIEWMEKRGHPFALGTEASIDLSDDAELMQMMVDAGFDSVFVGIETTDDDALSECGKIQNRNRDMLACVKRIQQTGLQVTAGFILGFDSDRSSVFDRLTTFIQKSGIVSAMVGLLNAPRNTRLYQRLKEENRLLGYHNGNNTDLSMNFVPKMSYETLISGYKNVLAGIYSPQPFYNRVKAFLREFKPVRHKRKRERRFRRAIGRLIALVKVSIGIGIIGKERRQYWNLLFWTLFKRPALLSLALGFAAYGHHFRKYFEDYIAP
ncbi:MAG: B12-binding domain-containing radical SAM protein [Planctomycetes bacterium]|nr:B12-binding domain-containing radical SAM protein [Planctomycetota bacterium]